MTTQKRILINLIILTIFSFRLSAQINETPLIQDILLNEDSLQGVNDDSLGFINKTPLYFYFKKTLVYLNEIETVSHSTYIQRNYADQFLRIYNDKKFLPASRIFGFSRDNRFYRSVNLGNRYYGFAEQIESGKMNLFSMDDILSYGEVKAVSDDGKNPDYNNYLLVMDYNRRKYRSQSYLYFISFDYNKQELIPVKAKELAGQYMKECPQASDYLKRIVGNPGSMTLRNFLAINFFSALFTSLIIPNEFNQAIGGLNNKTNYAYIYLSASGGAYFTYSLLHKKRIVKRENMQQAVKMYNACVK